MGEIWGPYRGMRGDFAHERQESDAVFYGKEMARAGVIISGMRREYDALWEGLLRFVAVTGRIEVPDKMILDPPKGHIETHHDAVKGVQVFEWVP